MCTSLLTINVYVCRASDLLYNDMHAFLQMNSINVNILTVVLVGISMATEIFYVLPDNSPNISCPSHHCATFSQYFLDNDTLPVVSNVEYHLLPGEHYVISTETVEFTNFQNFSLVGIINEQLQLSSKILVSTDIIIFDSGNVKIANVVFKMLFLSSGRLWLATCISCNIENVTLLGYGLLGSNLIGRSYLNNIIVNVTRSNTAEWCHDYQGITLHYFDYSLFEERKSESAPDKHTILIQKILIYQDNSTCLTSKGIIDIVIERHQTKDSVEIIINDSKFDNLVQKIIYIKQHDGGSIRCMILIMNCIFESNFVSSTPMITAEVSQFNTTLNFLKCKFHYIKNHNFLISVTSLDTRVNTVIDKDIMRTNITFNKCDFINNSGGLLFFDTVEDLPHYVCNILLIGPIYINGTENVLDHMIYIHNMVLHIHGPMSIVNNSAFDSIMVFTFCKIFINGPITLSNNMAFHKNIMLLNSCSALFQGPIIISDHDYLDSVMLLVTCDITFADKILFISNECNKIIAIQSEHTYIKVMQYANITFFSNRYYDDLLTFELSNDYDKPYPFCLFQYTSRNTSNVTRTDYTIIFTKNTFIGYHNLNCIKTVYRFISHCKWLPTSVFYGHNPGLINQQIIQIDDRKINHHNFICLLSSITHHDCAIDTLGPVYPGQLLQVELFTPCSENTSVIFAETHNNLLPSTACKIAHQTELLNTINNHSGTLNYTIVSDNTDMCELFLTTSPHLYHVYEAFYVKLLPCPVGFTLQNGICDCDPLLPHIDTCYIEQSVIRRPVKMWITAHVRSNDAKYLTGNCPMDYCLPYSSNVLLTNPDTQCQFNRTGVLCSQCQCPLSMVFGSSRCMKCTNLHILITFLIVLAGIVLVVLMYFLNLTVTNGTINGIIFYANIISINDSVFLINDVNKPLRVFISFTNLDLGIETCFYNGMDSYAKIWLQLFFPSYLIIIAISIIITSRYSPRILRLTYKRSLPVLATLFLLSYTGVLRVVLTVLFSYSTITHLPSGHQQLVWSIDASVPLFWLKFTILFITCLVLLFLLLIPFNIILIFTRYLSWFRFINRFKPLLDAFQGSYKDKYYYWVGMHIILRSIFYALYAFHLNLRLVLAVIILIIFACYFGYIQPYKNKAVNIQELLLLANLTILYAVSSYQNINNGIFITVTNVMISLAFIHFCIILLCHFLTYTCRYNVVIILVTLKEKLMKLCILKKSTNKQHYNIISLLDIPERTYNYSEYRDGLVSDDFENS